MSIKVKPSPFILVGEGYYFTYLAVFFCPYLWISAKDKKKKNQLATFLTPPAPASKRWSLANEHERSTGGVHIKDHSWLSRADKLFELVGLEIMKCCRGWESAEQLQQKCCHMARGPAGSRLSVKCVRLQGSGHIRAETVVEKKLNLLSAPAKSGLAREFLKIIFFWKSAFF